MTSGSRLHRERRLRTWKHQTAENIVDRLTSKRKDKRYTDNTNQLYNKITMNAEGQKDLDIASGVRKAELETKSVMVTSLQGKRGRQSRETERQTEARHTSQHRLSYGHHRRRCQGGERIITKNRETVRKQPEIRKESKGILHRILRA